MGARVRVLRQGQGLAGFHSPAGAKEAFLPVSPDVGYKG